MDKSSTDNGNAVNSFKWIWAFHQIARRESGYDWISIDFCGNYLQFFRLLRPPFVILSAAKDLCTLLGLAVAIPFSTQIAPCRILFDNQSNFLDPQPAFDLFLAGDRIADILKALEVYQSVQFVFRAEA
jgi:hypothetical protein